MNILLPFLISCIIIGAGVVWIMRRLGIGKKTTYNSVNKTKPCHDCKAEIPANAKKCMHCGSKQPQNAGVLGIIMALFVGYMIYSCTAAVNRPGSTRQPTTAEKQATHAERDASILCMQAVEANAKFPSSVDFSVLHSPPHRQLDGGGWAIFLAFESKNGFGNLIPQMARCDVVNGKLTSFSVSNR